MLHAFYSKVLFSYTVAIIIASMTGRTQAKQDRVWIINIMVTMRGMEKHAIAFSGAFGFPFPSVPDMTSLASPVCLLLTLSG